MKHTILAIVAGALLAGSHTPALAAIKKAADKKTGPASQAGDRKPDGLNLIPWPKSVKVSGGQLNLNKNSRIVAVSADLMPLATVLSNEILLATGFLLPVGSGKAAAGDIVLQIDRKLEADEEILTVLEQATTARSPARPTAGKKREADKNTPGRKVGMTRGYAHTLAVGDRAIVEGSDYRAVAEGTATLLQSLRFVEGKSLSLPRMTIKDWPHTDFNGVMVDCGRQYIPIEALHQMVEACRVYKVRYLHLHLSDDQGWTFPSKAFPRLGACNEAAHGGIPPKVYDLQQLKDLVAYADTRAVTLVPELETPGHSGAQRLAMPELFDAPKTPGGAAWLAVMNMANDEMYPALDTLVGEICDVFKSSPYFHIGCDECNLSLLAALPQTTAYLAKHKMNGIHELFLQHVKRMNEMVKKRGKMTIVWEGASLDGTLKDEVIVMTWVGDSSAATSYQQQGFVTITVPWAMPSWTDWNMYVCNASRLDHNDRVLGALLPMWEMSSDALINAYRPAIPKRQERTWGPDNVFAAEELEKRMEATEALVKKLILPQNP